MVSGSSDPLLLQHALDEGIVAWQRLPPQEAGGIKWIRWREVVEVPAEGATLVILRVYERTQVRLAEEVLLLFRGLLPVFEHPPHR